VKDVSTGDLCQRNEIFILVLNLMMRDEDMRAGVLGEGTLLDGGK